MNNNHKDTIFGSRSTIKKYVRQETCPVVEQLSPTTRIGLHASHFLFALREAFPGFTSEVDVEKLTAHWARILPDNMPIEQLLKPLGPALFSLSTEQDMPTMAVEGKKLSYYFPSKLWRFLRSLTARLRRDYKSDKQHRREKALHQAGFFGFVKKGSPPPSGDVVKNAKVKHCKALCTPRTSVGTVVNGEEITEENILTLERAIERSVDYLFPRQRRTFKVSGKLPSLNACFENSKQRWGMMGELIPPEIPAPRHRGEQEVLRNSYRDHLFQGGRRARLEFHLAPHQDHCLEARGVLYAVRQLPERLGLANGGVSIYRDEEQELTSRRAVLALFTDPLLIAPEYSARAAFIREPLKIRPIMAGPAGAYAHLFQCQNDLWGCMRRRRVTQLTCEPITDKFLTGLLGRFLTKYFHRHGEAAFLSSGDFEAATDNFLKRLILVTWNRISKNRGYGSHVRRVGAKGLVNHMISYTKQSSGAVSDLRLTIGDLEQVSGSSMGSPLSFPVLNAINLGIAACAYLEDNLESFDEPTPRRVQESDFSNHLSPLVEDWFEFFDELPAGLNGDDNVIAGSPKLKKIWEFWAAVSGSKSSIGKTYFSQDYCQMNSQLFAVERPSGGYPFYQKGYFFKAINPLNFGLIGPFSGRGSGIRHWTDLEPLWGAFKRCMPPQKEGTESKTSDPLATWADLAEEEDEEGKIVESNDLKLEILEPTIRKMAAIFFRGHSRPGYQIEKSPIPAGRSWTCNDCKNTFILKPAKIPCGSLNGEPQFKEMKHVTEFGEYTVGRDRLRNHKDTCHHVEKFNRSWKIKVAGTSEGSFDLDPRITDIIFERYTKFVDMNPFVPNATGEITAREVERKQKLYLDHLEQLEREAKTWDLSKVLPDLYEKEERKFGIRGTCQENLFPVPSLISRIPKGIPYSLPRWLGGAGIPSDSTISTLQRRVANYFFEENREKATPSLRIKENPYEALLHTSTSFLKQFEEVIPLEQDAVEIVDREVRYGFEPDRERFDARISHFIAEGMKLRTDDTVVEEPQYVTYPKEVARYQAIVRKSSKKKGLQVRPLSVLLRARPMKRAVAKDVVEALVFPNTYERDVSYVHELLETTRVMTTGKDKQLEMITDNRDLFNSLLDSRRKLT